MPPSTPRFPACRPLLAAVLGVACLPALAADPAPEIKRPPATPQAVGVEHTVRQIPEACALITGQFTGQAAEPYKFNVARTSPTCQPRARLVDAAKAKASAASGWILNDVVRVPSAACPSLQGVLHVWRKPAEAGPPQLDAQGRARIYLKDSTDAAKAGRLASIPQFAIATGVEGKPCGQ